MVKDFLKERKSSRDFKDKVLSTEELIKIEGILTEINEKDPYISLKLMLDGKRVHDALDGHAGYSGVMIKSPHYIVVRDLTKKPKEKTMIAVGMEDTVSKLSEMDIASCYVSCSKVSDEIRNKLFGCHGNKVEYAIAIGEAKKGFLDLSKPTSTRHSTSEIVFKDFKDTPLDEDELMHRGLDEVLYYTSFAPSYMNLQPWRFILTDKEIILATEKSEIHDSTFVDIGIAMYYFSKLASLAGHRGEWKLSEQDETQEKYEIVARYNL